MSIDMYLGDSDRQNQSVSSIIKSRSNHYNNLQGPWSSSVIPLLFYLELLTTLRKTIPRKF